VGRHALKLPYFLGWVMEETGNAVHCLNMFNIVYTISNISTVSDIIVTLQAHENARVIREQEQNTKVAAADSRVNAAELKLKQVQAEAKSDKERQCVELEASYKKLKQVQAEAKSDKERQRAKLAANDEEVK
jgi:hypothetical protein